MGTTIRAEVSKKNPYWIEKHRYYELKHFCLQYPIWRQAYVSLGGMSSNSSSLEICRDKYNMSNPTERIAMIRSNYAEKMDMIEKAAEESNSDIASYILMGVTKGVSYTLLSTKYDIPCCKDVYYESYRRFFWLLSKKRN